MNATRWCWRKWWRLGFITIPEAENAFMEFWPEYYGFISGLPPTYNVWSARLDKTPWFTEYVRRILITKYGEEAVYEQGLMVYTTVDLKKQVAAQDVMSEALKRQTTESSRLAYQNDEYLH